MDAVLKVSPCLLFVLHNYNLLSHLCLSLRLRPLYWLSFTPPPPPFAISRIISLFNCCSCWLRHPPPPTTPHGSALLQFDAIQLPTAGQSRRAAIVRALNYPNAGLDGHQTRRRRRNKGAIVDSERPRIKLAKPACFMKNLAVVGGPPRRRRFISTPTKRCCRRRRNLEQPSPGCKGGI